MVVLVTGASGYLGSHVVKELLSRGYRVKATTRSLVNAEFLNKFSGDLEIVEMDLLDVERVKEVVRGCEYVIHCAAALAVGVNNPQRDVVDPSIEGTRNLISGMGDVRGVVHTSSVAAIRSTNYENGKVFSNNDWCEDATVKSNAYGLAKAGAERLIREWANNNDVRLVTINPSIIFGPILDKRHLNGSMGYLKHFVGRAPFVLDIHINFVDVRDVAIAHVNALESGVNGGRYLLHSRGLWMKEIGQLLREKKPGRKWAIRRLPNILACMITLLHPKVRLRDLRGNLGSWVSYDIGNTLKELSLDLTSSEATIIDGVDSIIDIQNKG